MCKSMRSIQKEAITARVVDQDVEACHFSGERKKKSAMRCRFESANTEVVKRNCRYCGNDAQWYLQM